MTYWCTICNSAPSDGQLTIENPIDAQAEPLVIEACKSCVYSLDWEGGIVKKENDHDQVKP